MRLLLVSTNRDTSPFPVMPFGACVVAQASADAGHEVRFLDLMGVGGKDAPGALGKAVAGFNPDAVGLSVRNIDNNNRGDPEFFLSDLKELADAAKRASNAPIILGGAAMGVMPREIMRHAGVSVGVLGRGEAVFPKVLERLSRGETVDDLEGVAVLREGRFTAKPFGDGGGYTLPSSPDFSRWLDTRSYLDRMGCVPLQTKTGCRFRCVYCTYHRIEGSVNRMKAPDEVAREVRELYAAGFRDIEFVDSVFNAPADHAKEVCRAIARHGRGPCLHCLELNPLDVDDELAGLMEKAGFAGMGITLESASATVLSGLNKGFTLREVNTAAQVVARHKIPCAWIFLLGGPNETNETVEETLNFARTRVRTSDVAFFNVGLRVYPGTELEKIARAQGVLDLSPDRMLEPVFYLSPTLDSQLLKEQLSEALNENMNFIGIDTMKLPILPFINRVGHRLGVRPPLWKHTRYLRRGLRLVGLNV